MKVIGDGGDFIEQGSQKRFDVTAAEAAKRGAQPTHSAPIFAAIVCNAATR